MAYLKKSFFIILLPAFFVFHGFTMNFNSVPAKDALLLWAEYIIVTLFIAAIAWLFLRDVAKACVMALLIMSFYLFFGPIQDFLKEYFANSFITKYRFILPAAAV